MESSGISWVESYNVFTFKARLEHLLQVLSQDLKDFNGKLESSLFTEIKERKINDFVDRYVLNTAISLRDDDLTNYIKHLESLIVDRGTCYFSEWYMRCEVLKEIKSRIQKVIDERLKKALREYTVNPTLENFAALFGAPETKKAEESFVIGTATKVIIFKHMMENHWKEEAHKNSFSRRSFIEWVGKKKHAEKDLNAFLVHIQTERDACYDISDEYREFLNDIKSKIEGIIKEREDKKDDKCFKDKLEDAWQTYLKGFQCSKVYAHMRLTHFIDWVKGYADTEEELQSLVGIIDEKVRVQGLSFISYTDISYTEKYKKFLETVIARIQAVINENKTKPKLVFAWDTADCSSYTALGYGVCGRIERPEDTPDEPKPNLIFSVTGDNFKELLLGSFTGIPVTHKCLLAICAIQTLAGLCFSYKEILEKLSTVKFSTSEIRDIALDIMKRINNKYIYGYNPLSYCIKMAIEESNEYFSEKTKPSDTFKPGDRVFFIKESIHSVGNQPYMEHLYLGIVKDWAVGSQGRVHCTFDSSFNVMSLENLDLDIADSEDVENLINHEDFSKSLMRANPNVLGNPNATFSVYGDISLCPVDESLFPKLNKILAKVTEGEKK